MMEKSSGEATPPSAINRRRCGYGTRTSMEMASELKRKIVAQDDKGSKHI